MISSYIEIARERVSKGNFCLSHHAQTERGKEKIRMADGFILCAEDFMIDSLLS